MISQKNLKIIKQTTEEFFAKLSFEVQIEFLPQKETTLSINLKSEDPRILIGEKGETLFEIQHILRAILKRKISRTEEPFYLDLDINDYKKKKTNYLKELARSSAEEVALTKKEKILFPMSAYERRIIHLELADEPNIATESIGQEPERKVVIRTYL